MVRQTIFIADIAASIVSIVMQIQEATGPGTPAPGMPAPGTGIAGQIALEQVAKFDDQRPTGVAVSKNGRLFVNFPRWADEHTHSVVEVMPDGSMKPYPDERWNAWKPDDATATPSRSFVCVQSVWIDDQDMLWVLDPASPKMEGIVRGGPKLVKINLATNTVERTYALNEDVAPLKSYLNDVRVDTNRNFAYMTESGLGALVVLNLQSGQARRLLDDHPSTKAEAGVTLTVQGKTLKDPSGQTPQVHADGIALSRDGEQLYYHALTAKTLYRVPTAALRGEDASSSQGLAEAVENLGETVATDGMEIDGKGNVYHTAFEQDAIVRFSPAKELETVAQDQRINWPDSVAWAVPGSGAGELYFTTSQLQHMPRFNEGKEMRSEPFYVYKITIPEDARADAR